MENTNPSSYCAEWQQNRIDYILSLYPASFFKDKHILELGCFNGWIGNYFSQVMGASVTSVEGRSEYVETIKRDYPSIDRVLCADLDTTEWSFGKYDIIVNFGLYYHLEKFHREHLFNCIDNCDLLLFESVIFDSNESKIHFRNESWGIDQSLSGVGGSPSTKYIEDIFAEKRCRFEKHTSQRLNGGAHHYDWKDGSLPDGFDPYARRFWVVNTKE